MWKYEVWEAPILFVVFFAPKCVLVRSVGVLYDLIAVGVSLVPS